jgi:putative endonuclease
LAALRAGEAAELEAASALVARGWRILARRLRIGRWEVDLVAQRDDVVAVVEVRGRRADGWIEPLDSISPSKRRAVASAARALWSRRFSSDASVRVMRIDVVAVTWRAKQPPLVEIVEGAFEVG